MSTSKQATPATPPTYPTVRACLQHHSLINGLPIPTGVSVRIAFYHHLPVSLPSILSLIILELRHRNDKAMDIMYSDCALSHCWGSGVHGVFLRHENLLPLDPPWVTLSSGRTATAGWISPRPNESTKPTRKLINYCF